MSATTSQLTGSVRSPTSSAALQIDSRSTPCFLVHDFLGLGLGNQFAEVARDDAQAGRPATRRIQLLIVRECCQEFDPAKNEPPAAAGSSAHARQSDD
jgi:hypothetical protein